MTTSPLIVISEFMDGPAVERLAATHRTLYDPGLVDDPERLASVVGDARALVVRNRTQVRPALLDRAPKLEVVGRLSVGLDNIDLDACRSRGIAVRPATGANSTAVAEYVIAAAMMLVRGAYLSTAEVAAGNWPRNRLIGGELCGRTLGLIGFGDIARQVADRARALGMNCVAFDPHLPDDDPAWQKTRRADLDTLLETSDVVSLHVPLTDETRHLIDAARLATMKAGACLINTARGGVLDEAALVKALRHGHIGGAALDVFENEPLSASGGAAYAGLTNLILTPHIAGVTHESNVRVSDMIAEAVLAELG